MNLRRQLTTRRLHQRTNAGDRRRDEATEGQDLPEPRRTQEHADLPDQPLSRRAERTSSARKRFPHLRADAEHRLHRRAERFAYACLHGLPQTSKLTHDGRRLWQSIERPDDQRRICQQRARSRERSEASCCLPDGFGDVLEGEFAVLHGVGEWLDLSGEDVDVLARAVEGRA